MKPEVALGPEAGSGSCRLRVGQGLVLAGDGGVHGSLLLHGGGVDGDESGGGQTGSQQNKMVSLWSSCLMMWMWSFSLRVSCWKSCHHPLASQTCWLEWQQWSAAWSCLPCLMVLMKKRISLKTFLAVVAWLQCWEGQAGPCCSPIESQRRAWSGK